jgi:PKD repeat protein
LFATAVALIALGSVQSGATAIIMFGVPQEEGDTIRVTGYFTSSGTHAVKSVDWGDGTSNIQNPSVVESGRQASATHVYAQDGTYTVTISITNLNSPPTVESTTSILRILNARYVLSCYCSCCDIGRSIA